MAALNYIKNSSNGTVIVHVTGSNTLVAVGNDSVSNLALTGETVTRASIRQVWFGSPSGNGAYWTITRGPNGTSQSVVGQYDSTSWVDYAGTGSALTTLDDEAEVYFTITNAGDTASYIMVEFKKELAG